MQAKIFWFIFTLLIVFGWRYWYDYIFYRDIDYNNNWVSYYENGDNENAILEYQKALDIKPNSSLYNYNISLAYYDLVDYNKALFYADKALENFKPWKDEVISKSELYSNRGWINYLLWNVDEAESDVDNSLELDSEDLWWLYYKASLLFDDWEFSSANWYIDKYLSLDKENENAYVLKWNISYYLEKMSDAIASYNIAITIDGYDYLPYYYLGDVYLYLWDYNSALDSYKKAYELEEDYFLNSFYVWYSYYKLWDYDNAYKYMQNSYNLDWWIDDYAVLLYNTILLDKLWKSSQAQSFMVDNLDIDKSKFQEFISLDKVFDEDWYYSLSARINKL